MTHIKISQQGSKPVSVIVDGIEVNKMIMRDGFSIDVGAPDEFKPSTVTMAVAADVLEVDLPDAVVRALRAPDDESEPSA